VPASCRTDSECGAGGVCSLSINPGTCGHIDGFFCRTPQDTCATDNDCALQQYATSCEHIGAPSSGSWACQEPYNCPFSSSGGAG
jgi:hypothetical protein